MTSKNVLLINGSPHQNGCTYTALAEIAAELAKAGVDSEIAWIGRNPIRGCQACMSCTDGRGKCAFDDDVTNSIIAKAAAADGLVVGSPVYYAGVNGALKCLLDRMFFASGPALRGKPAAAVASARRAGTTSTIDDINRFFHLKQMPIATGSYWPVIHGSKAADALQDAEGLQTMRNLARTMAWMLDCLGDQPAPQLEYGANTNFIR